MNKVVGIVIPSYNQGKYLERTIKSALENAKNAVVRIALIDGGSTDNSLQIIERYRDLLDVCISEPDGGQAAAINKGIRALQGCDYYMWLNSDDEYEDEYSIKKIVEFSESNGYEVCYGKSHFIDEASEIIGEYPVEKYSHRKLGNRCYISQPSVLFSAKAYESVGPLNEHLHMCLDYEYWIRLSKVYKFGFINHYIGSTRLYDDTKTANQKRRHLSEAMFILKKYYERIPMKWVVTEYRNEHAGAFLSRQNYFIAALLLFFRKKKIISDCINRLGINATFVI
ncbi:MAG: glycosyltransferase [Lachnospiraceae bacterium]|nr:glycosyltransferase [Lachnospiraceae bacterium]